VSSLIGLPVAHGDGAALQDAAQARLAQLQGSEGAGPAEAEAVECAERLERIDAALESIMAAEQ